jgi:hypothetical protein
LSNGNRRNKEEREGRKYFAVAWEAGIQQGVLDATERGYTTLVTLVYFVWSVDGGIALNVFVTMEEYPY